MTFSSLVKMLFRSSEEPPNSAKTMSRNAPCWCGSDKKYKHCHFQKDREHMTAKQNEDCQGPT